MEFLLFLADAGTNKSVSLAQWLDKNPLVVVLLLTMVLIILAQFLRPMFRQAEEEKEQVQPAPPPREITAKPGRRPERVKKEPVVAEPEAKVVEKEITRKEVPVSEPEAEPEAEPTPAVSVEPTPVAEPLEKVEEEKAKKEKKKAKKEKKKARKEEPKVEEPKVEEPKVEEVVVPVQEPAVVEPVAEEPKAEPVVEEPRVEKKDEEEARRERHKKLQEKRAVHVSEMEVIEEAETAAPRTLREGLESTRKGWVSRLGDLLRGKKEFDEDLLDELEEILFTADIGTRTTQQLLQTIEEKMDRNELSDPEKVKEAIKDEIYRILTFDDEKLDFDRESPFVVMVVGVNGVGKTTTIGKLAARLSLQDKKVVVAAADTFRAAAVEQLEHWASKVDADVIKGQPNQDPSSVVFDAVKAGVARGADVILADTAGRLHTKQNLMEELKKIKRVMGRACASAPHEILLVVDATTGQNAVTQAKQFNEALGLTGIILTKLDGTAKGGVVVAIAEELKIPIRFIGVGEHINELRAFSAAEFVEALF